ncbi:MAG: protein-disulfide reductase DsbD [Steroidobacteraceae bacterium]
MSLRGGFGTLLALAALAEFGALPGLATAGSPGAAAPPVAAASASGPAAAPAASPAGRAASATARPNVNQVLELGHVGSGEGSFLPPDEAFRLSATAQGPDRIELLWQIAPGYYLYRNRLKVAASGAVELGQLALPEGQRKTDPFFGTQQVYHDELDAMLPVARAASAAALAVPLKVTYQGCADAGLCYPPITKMLRVSLPPGTGGVAAAAARLAVAGSSSSVDGTGATFLSEQDRYASVVRSGSFGLLIAFFYAAGLVLAFTPCCLPMVPILSGLIVGGGRRVTAGRAFALSLTYVVGMALTYTAAGIAVAAGGAHVQAAFEQPWVVTAFAALFVLLALSMFGMFTLQMPASIQTRLAGLSSRQEAGTFGGVLVMGALSALIVTTCVAPALVGALLVIGRGGDMVRGGIALFVMGLGMGTPLIVVGTSAGKLLPKSGAWMDIVKGLFGALMLAVAAWMLVRVVPSHIALLLWAVPALAAAAVLGRGTRALRGGVVPVRIAACAAGLYGLALIVGAALGGTDPLTPLPPLAAHREALAFRPIHSVADLDRAVAAAHADGRPVMLDFTADWCVSCKEMDRYTFTDPAVIAALRGAVLLRADVTGNDRDDQALLAHFGIYGPPTIAFYGADGRERRNLRVVGYMKSAEFTRVVERAVAPLQRHSPAAADSS